MCQSSCVSSNATLLASCIFNSLLFAESSTSPPNVSGSGTRIDANVPCSSIGRTPCLQTSQLARKNIGPADERKYSVQGSKGTDRKGLVFVGTFGAVPAFQRADLPHGSDFADWTKQSRQRGYIVGTEIQHRTGTLLIKDSRIWVPMLHSFGHHCGQTCDDLSDTPLVDQSFGGLQAGSEDCVRRRTYTLALRLGLVNQGNGILQGGRQRLLTIDVLPRSDRSSGDFRMGCRKCEIEYDLDVVSGQKSPDIHLAQGIFVS